MSWFSGYASLRYRELRSKRPFVGIFTAERCCPNSVNFKTGLRGRAAPKSLDAHHLATAAPFSPFNVKFGPQTAHPDRETHKQQQPCKPLAATPTGRSSGKKPPEVPS
jgi:hypothetical protein